MQVGPRPSAAVKFLVKTAWPFKRAAPRSGDKARQRATDGIARGGGALIAGMGGVARPLQVASHDAAPAGAPVNRIFQGAQHQSGS